MSVIFKVVIENGETDADINVKNSKSEELLTLNVALAKAIDEVTRLMLQKEHGIDLSHKSSSK